MYVDARLGDAVLCPDASLRLPGAGDLPPRALARGWRQRQEARQIPRLLWERLSAVSGHEVPTYPISCSVTTVSSLLTRGLGGSLAYAELYLTLATVVRRFDWDMYATGLDDIVCKRDFFVAVADLESKGVRAVLRSRA